MSAPAVASAPPSVSDGLVRNIAVDILARVGYIVTRFLIPPFVLAHVSLQTYGLWSTAFILVAYLGISTMGLSSVNVKFVAEYTARREYAKANALLSTGMTIAVPVCTVLFALVWFLWGDVVGWLKIAPELRADAREVVLAVTAIFLLSSSLSGFRDALIGAQLTASAQTIWTVTYVAEVVLILLLVGNGRGIRGLAEAFLVRAILEIVLSANTVFRKLPWLSISPRLCTREALRTTASFGGVVQFSSFLAIALNSIERVIALPLLGIEAAGLLDIGKKMPATAISIPSAFASSFVPAASHLHGGSLGEASGSTALRGLYLQGARFMGMVSSLLFAFMAVLALVILDVWLGRRFENTDLIMSIFAISSQVHLMTGPGSAFLRGSGRPREELYYLVPNFAMLGVILLLYRMLFSSWTAVGIAACTALSTILSAGWFVLRTNTLLGVPFRVYAHRVLLPAAIPFLVAGAVAMPVQAIAGKASRWELAFVLAFAGFCYLFVSSCILVRSVFDHQEKEWVQARLGSRISAWLDQ